MPSYNYFSNAIPNNLIDQIANSMTFNSAFSIEGYTPSTVLSNTNVLLIDQYGNLHPLNLNITSFNQILQSNYYAGTSYPTNVQNNTLFYNTQTNVLYKYINNDWVAINWQNIIENSVDYKFGIIRISSGQLQITPNSGTNWYNCIPAVGANVINIRTIDNTNYSYLYYMLPGQTLNFFNANHIPVVFNNTQINSYRINLNNIFTNSYTAVQLYLGNNSSYTQQLGYPAANQTQCYSDILIHQWSSYNPTMYSLYRTSSEGTQSYSGVNIGNYDCGSGVFGYTNSIYWFGPIVINNTITSISNISIMRIF